jgi:hypothetical protein
MDMYALLEEMSNLLHEKDMEAEDEAAFGSGGGGRQAGNGKKKPRKRRGWYDDGTDGDSTRRARWREARSLWMELERVAGGPKSLAGMIVEGLANTVLPRGHGGKAARKLSTRDGIIAALVTERGGAFKDWLFTTVRAADKSEDHVQDHLRAKRKGKISYDALDCYLTAIGTSSTRKHLVVGR